MQIIKAFFILIRWPNLLFIILAQGLFYFCIVQPTLPHSYFENAHSFTIHLFWCLTVASVLIAASGYIINDYFDRNIDLVNKPKQIVIDKTIKRRTAIILHFLFNLLGITMSFYVSYYTNYLVVLINGVCILLLWLYSTSFKKKMLTGNIIISFLTAWTILVIYFAVNPIGVVLKQNDFELLSAVHVIYKYAALYSGFAFLTTLIREVIKDVEDIEGDRRYGCTTLPIVWGIPAAKLFIAVWLVVLAVAIMGLLVYFVHYLWWGFVFYCILLLGLVAIGWRKTIIAESKEDFTYLSNFMKLIILVGILSLTVIYFHLS